MAVRLFFVDGKHYALMYVWKQRIDEEVVKQMSKRPRIKPPRPRFVMVQKMHGGTDSRGIVNRLKIKMQKGSNQICDDPSVMVQDSVGFERSC